MQSAELGLEGGNLCFAKVGLSRAGAAMAGDMGTWGRRGRRSLQPGSVGVQEGCNRAHGQILPL